LEAITFPCRVWVIMLVVFTWSAEIHHIIKEINQQLQAPT
jgi:hypothetical protein